MDLSGLEAAGREIVGALAMMGHDLGVRTVPDPATCSTVVEVCFHERDSASYTEAQVRLDDAGLAYAENPAEMIAYSVEAALRRLVDDRIRGEVARVVVALRKGPLPCELLGGPEDGKRVSLPMDGNGWPPPIFTVPVSYRSAVPWADPVEPQAITMQVQDYRREFVSPSLLAWVYRPARQA